MLYSDLIFLYTSGQMVTCILTLCCLPLSAEVRKLASYSKLHEIQQSLLDGLVDVAQKYHPDNLRHIPSILLLLTHIRQAADRATTYFQSLKKEGSVNFCDLLTEMLDAQSDDKNTSTTSAGC